MPISRACLSGLLLATSLTLTLGGQARAETELARLTEENWSQWAPAGKEVDCILGDYVLRNDQLIAVIAQPLSSRNANMTVRNVGGMVIDLTRRQDPSDQLSAYYAGGGSFAFHDPGLPQVLVDGTVRSWDGTKPLKGKTIELLLTSRRRTDGIQDTLRYSLAADQDFVVAQSTYRNLSDKSQSLDLRDAIRADRTFAFSDGPAKPLFWAYDEWFGQAYGVLADKHTITRSGGRGTALDLAFEQQTSRMLPAGGEHVVRRQLIPAAHALEVLGRSARMSGQACRDVRLQINDPAGPVQHATVALKQGGQVYGQGRANAQGTIQFALPEGVYTAEVAGLGRPAVSLDIEARGAVNGDVQLQPCGYVQAEIKDAAGQPIPCKVSFHGREGTADPYFGPDSGDFAVLNACYTADGRFRQEIAPGKYDVIVSRGPEFDAVFTQIDVQAGQTTRLAAQLKQTVDSRGWISTDFHSHSSPSGDNTGSQLGRVLNLLAEHIEFAPCTEHNRIDSYTPRLQRLKSEHLMATCTGMELTGSPLPINHQNAFPLIHKPRTQDGGAPLTDTNPVVQIERLALWDGGSDKLVQCNHPNLVQMLADRDLDGKFDGGFEKMFGFMDVVEVHPPAGILTPPTGEPAGRGERNPIFHWMQMLNLGYRISGVVNTDAHYNFHESGWLRNYVPSRTDDPAKIQTMDVVHAAEEGRVVMTTGPFLEVSMTTGNGPQRYLPGQDVKAPDRQVLLHVKVQCSNWLDINRVQILLNGRAVESLNWTRRNHPEKFGQGVVKFESAIPVPLDQDAHLIVVAAGEGLELGPVMGPRGKTMPVAVTNPFFVDVDGNGFQANGDLLDVPLPEGVSARKK